MTDTIVLVGYNPERTPRMIDELCADAAQGRRIVVFTRKALEDPDPRTAYVRAATLTSKADLRRAGVEGAHRVVVYADTDEETLAAALAVTALNRTAHVVCFFNDPEEAELLNAHRPEVECVLATGPELVVRAVQDPGASKVMTALLSNLDPDATLFSLDWPDVARASHREAAHRMLDLGATLMAVQPQGAAAPRFSLDPAAPLAPGDRVFYVASARLNPATLAARP